MTQFNADMWTIGIWLILIGLIAEWGVIVFIGVFWLLGFFLYKISDKDREND